MDNTLHYLTYDPDAIWSEIMAAYFEQGGDVIYPGDEKDMLLRAVQAVIVQAFAGVDNALRMQTLRYAVGEYLDLIGENRACSRILATKAKAQVTITFAETGIPGILEKGTIMTADGERLYELAQNVGYTGRAEDTAAEIICTVAGENGNGISAGTEMQLLNKNSAASRIIVSEGAHGGQEREDDESYRERIRTFGLASVTTGPRSMYQSAARAVSTEVVDAKAVRSGAGEVLVALIVYGDDTEDIISRVQEALNAEDRRPLTDHVTVAQAQERPYMLKAIVTLPDAPGFNAQAAMTEACTNYMNWQNSVIGRPFNPDMLKSMLYTSGCVRVEFDQSSYFDEAGTEPEYTEIGETDRCLGTAVWQVSGT